MHFTLTSVEPYFRTVLLKIATMTACDKEGGTDKYGNRVPEPCWCRLETRALAHGKNCFYGNNVQTARILKEHLNIDLT